MNLRVSKPKLRQKANKKNRVTMMMSLKEIQKSRTNLQIYRPFLYSASLRLHAFSTFRFSLCPKTCRSAGESRYARLSF